MKKIFIFFLTILLSYCLTIFLSSPVHAQDAPPPENWVDSDYAGGITGALESGEVNAPAYASHMQTNFMADGVRKILGPVPGVTITADAYKNNPRLVAQMQGQSAVASIGNYMAMMYANPPADLALWVRDTGQTLGFIPRQANAQGIGFSGLAPLLPLWKAFRNIAYVLMSVVLIVIGFMVMLRKKIDPKTVVTVQNALPKIVVTLLLITFSYAIVGILIDFMYIVLFLLIMLFSQGGFLKITPEITSAFVNGSLKNIIDVVFPHGGITLLQLVTEIAGPAVVGSSAIVGALVGILVTGTITPLSWLAGIVGAAVGAAAPSIILTLLLSLILLFAYIRLFFTLFNSFLQVVLALLFGPLQLLLEALPGTNSFSSWFMNIVSNLLAFPITAAMFLLSFSFSSMIIPWGTSSKMWLPPFLIGNTASSDSIIGLISLGLLLLTPQLINAAKEALKVKPVLPVGSAFGASLSQPASTFMQGVSALYYIKQLTAKQPPPPPKTAPKKEE